MILYIIVSYYILQSFLKALHGYEEILDANDTYILSTLNNLAVLKRQQNKLKDAENLLRRSLQGHSMNENVGIENPMTLGVMNNLAIVLKQLNKIKESQELYKKCLDLRKKVLGEQHGDTLDTLSNYAALLKEQGKIKIAEKYYLEAIKGLEIVNGSQHPATLSAVHGLGILYLDSDIGISKGKTNNNLEKASELLHQSLDGYEKNLGCNHPSTLNALSMIAVLYKRQRKYEESEMMYHRAINGFESVQGIIEYIHIIGYNDSIFILYQCYNVLS